MYMTRVNNTMNSAYYNVVMTYSVLQCTETLQTENTNLDFLCFFVISETKIFAYNRVFV